MLSLYTILQFYSSDPNDTNPHKRIPPLPSPPLPFPLARHNLSLSTVLSAPASLSIEQVARDLDIGSLQRNLTNIAFCDIEAEDLRNVDQHVVKLFKLAQLMYVHESTILFL